MSPPHIAWGSLLLFVCPGDLSPLSYQGQQRSKHPSTHLGYGGLSVRSLATVCTFGDHPGSQTEVRIKQDLLQFLNLPGCGENCIRKFSCFSVRVGACCTGLPAGLPIKENPGEPGFQSAASDGHHHTTRGHNLNYTIWTMYAESESSYQCHTPLGVP
jgi:hypothetical protein